MVGSPTSNDELSKKSAASAEGNALPHAATPAASHTHNSAQPRSFISAGERVHTAFTYGAMDWLLNSAVGVTFAMIVNRTKVGQKYIAEPVVWLAKQPLKLIFKNEQTLSKAANGGKDLLSIAVGGTAINPILTHLEKHENKRGFTESVDRVIYGNDAVDHDPKFKQAYKEIENEPVRDAKAAWVSRIISLVPVLAISSTPSAMKFFSSHEIPVLKYINFDHISGYSRGLANKLGIKPNAWMKQTQTDKTTGEVLSNWDTMHRLIGFDYGLTIFYAMLHAVTFGLVAKHEKKDENVHKRDVASTLSEAAPASTHAQSLPSHHAPLNQVMQAQEISRLADTPSLQATV